MIQTHTGGEFERMEGSGKSWEHGGERKKDEAIQFKANGVSTS